MRWFDLAVSPDFSWPKRQIEIPFEGYMIVLQPRRHGPENKMELAATVSVFDPKGISFEIGGTVVSRFLSRLAWSCNGGVVELFGVGSNLLGRPGRLGQSTYQRPRWAQVEPWDSIYFPVTDSQEADLALGLFREGMSVNSTPLAFLSYFKVLNIHHGGGTGQKKWINDNLHGIWHRPALDRLAEIQKTEADIGKYLHEEGRCAVAHAYGTLLVNPDSYSDRRRMENDLKLMKEIAALFIETELGVLSDRSYWKSRRKGGAPKGELLRKVVQANGEQEIKKWQEMGHPLFEEPCYTVSAAPPFFFSAPCPREDKGHREDNGKIRDTHFLKSPATLLSEITITTTTTEIKDTHFLKGHNRDKGHPLLEGPCYTAFAAPPAFSSAPCPRTPP